MGQGAVTGQDQRLARNRRAADNHTGPTGREEPIAGGRDVCSTTTYVVSATATGIIRIPGMAVPGTRMYFTLRGGAM